MRTELRRGRPFRLAVTAATVALLLAGVLLYAGCQSEQQAKQQQFKEQWTKIMDQFQAQVATDDKKATDLVNKNDIPALIKLTKERVASTQAVLGKILALYPPTELRKLQALTSYYLVTLIDRLQAQADYSLAVLGNKPTTDLQNNLNQLAGRNNTIGSELSVELAKDGITLKTPSQPKTTTPSSTPTSSPSTTPGK